MFVQKCNNLIFFGYDSRAQHLYSVHEKTGIIFFRMFVSYYNTVYIFCPFVVYSEKLIFATITSTTYLQLIFPSNLLFNIRFLRYVFTFMNVNTECVAVFFLKEFRNRSITTGAKSLIFLARVYN